MKYLLTFALVTFFLLGCSKEEPSVKTANHVKIHEIAVMSQDSTAVFWYIFYKDGKFIYTNSKIPLDDFAGVFFTSSKKIPNELKFTEEFVRTTSSDSGDTWGLSQIDSSQVVQDTLVDSVNLVDSVPKIDPFMTGDSLTISDRLDSMPGESRRQNLPKVYLDYEIPEP